MTAPILKFNPSEATALAREVTERSGQPIHACYQCRRCAAGCPVGEETGFLTPDRLIRLVIMGDTEAALNNELVWKCVSCYTCGTRCPNDIQTARITETLKKMAKEKHLKPLHPKVANFHEAFINSSVRWGRLNEVEFMGFYEMKNSIADLKKGDIMAIVNEMLTQAKFGLEMVKAKRMHAGFQTSKGRGEIKRLLKKAKSK